MKSKLKIIGVSAILIAGAGMLVFSAEKYTERAEFCGLQCHIMKNAYEVWKTGKHKTGKHSKIKQDVLCVDCHYAPGVKLTPKAKLRSLGQLFSYLATKEKEVRRRARVDDMSCIAADCHPREKFIDKKIKIDYKTDVNYVDYKGVIKPFTHKTHEEKTIEGQKLHCSSCHIHQSPGKHLEVPKELCFICHFRRAKDNDGRAKCSICHEIPTKSLQKQRADEEKSEDETIKSKPITHETLEKAKVPCYGCHFELIRGKIALKKDSCIECHHDPTPELMRKIEDKKVMHNAHVTKQTARCFNCHEPIQHEKPGYLYVPYTQTASLTLNTPIKNLPVSAGTPQPFSKETAYLYASIPNCANCHPEPHLYQEIIIAGEKGRGVKKTPALMHDVKTNCMGCHTDTKGYDQKGRRVAKGSPQACVSCHTKDHEKMVKKWIKEVSEELNTAKDIEKEAVQAIESAKGNAPDKRLKAAMAMLKEGQENLRIVDAGGGVHNKKYSIMLIDAAIKDFEDLIDDLKKSD